MFNQKAIFALTSILYSYLISEFKLTQFLESFQEVSMSFGFKLTVCK